MSSWSIFLLHAEYCFVASKSTALLWSRAGLAPGELIPEQLCQRRRLIFQPKAGSRFRPRSDPIGPSNCHRMKGLAHPGTTVEAFRWSRSLLGHSRFSLEPTFGVDFDPGICKIHYLTMSLPVTAA